MHLMSGMFRKLGYPVGATVITASACVAYERMPATIDPESKIGRLTSPVITGVRFTRSLIAATVIAADYKRLFYKFSDYQSEEYKQARSLVHKRSAERCLNLGRTQGAVYVKVGQHIASMNHSIPKEYTSRLKLLEDRAAYRPYWQIERVLKKQYNVKSLNDIFLKIDETPVAAASLAQVHKATLKQNNQQVAIKVQYPGLESLVQGDLLSIRLLSWLLHFIFPYLNLNWLVNQFKANLQKEVDFYLEAHNANRTCALFENNSHIHVPKVHNEFSSKRILVMDFINGWRIDDVKSMKEAGINTPAVAHAVVDAFAQMVFIDGHVHMDPHGGNVMVRPKGNKGDFEVFLLDHGLYSELSDGFRHAYCKLWKGLVLRRLDQVKEACDELGAGGLENILSVMLLNRSWKSASKMRTDIRTKMSEEEVKELKEELKDSGLKSQADVSSFVEKVPEELWLVFKMNSLVRNVNKSLGASVNRFKLNVRYALRGLSVVNDEDDLSLSQNTESPESFTVASGEERGYSLLLSSLVSDVSRWLSSVVDVFFVEIRLLLIDAARITYSYDWWDLFTRRRKDGIFARDEVFQDSLLG